MSFDRTLTLARHEVRYIRRFVVPPILYVAIPLVLMAFLENSGKVFFRSFGYLNANGAEYVVPAQTVLFCYVSTEHLGMFVFSEHQWGTWNRVRATAASTGNIVGAKVATWALLLSVETLILFVGGGALYRLHIAGSTLAVAMILAANVVTTLAFAFCGLAISPTSSVYDAWTYGGGLFLSALGGGLTPSQLLPSWAARISPASPAYWAVSGFRSVILDGRGIDAAWRPVGMLLVFAAGFALVGWWRFDATRPKIGANW